MSALRSLVMDHRRLAGLVLAFALALKLLVPAGFMPAMSDGRFVVSICTAAGPTTMVMAVPMRGDAGGGDRHGKPDAPCAFAGLSAPLLAAADPVLLAGALLFVMAAALRPLARSQAAASSYLRPPLRGPPTLA